MVRIIVNLKIINQRFLCEIFVILILHFLIDIIDGRVYFKEKKRCFFLKIKKEKAISKNIFNKEIHKLI